MRTRAPPLAVVLAAVALTAPFAAASTTAEWKGTTDTLLCADHRCQILSPPADDARVQVGTGHQKELRLTLEAAKGGRLALQYESDGHRITTPASAKQTTSWMRAPADGVLEVTVLDLSPIPSTGLRPGVAFTLTAEYR